VGKSDLRSFFHMKDRIQEDGEAKGALDVAWERNGETISQSIQPTATSERDPILRKMTNFTIGLMPMLALTESVMLTHRILNPFVLVYEGTARMLVLSWRNLVSIA